MAVRGREIPDMKRLAEKLKSSWTSRVDTDYRIGMRVVKTAAAVMVCLIIALIMKSANVMQIAGVSALVTLRSTQRDTFLTGLFRVLGTVIGGLLGMLAVLIGLFLPYYSEGLFVIVIPLMIILDMYICNLLKMQDSCSISCVVIIMVASQVNLEASVGEALVFTLFRIRDTLIGVVVSTIINNLHMREPT